MTASHPLGWKPAASNTRGRRADRWSIATKPGSIDKASHSPAAISNPATGSQLVYSNSLDQSQFKFLVPCILTSKCSCCQTPAALGSRLHTGEKRARAIDGFEQSDQNEQGRYCCPVCPRSYQQKVHMTRHRRSLPEAYEFRCPDCSKVFYRRDQLLQHGRTHMNKTTDCTVVGCGLPFHKKAQLYEHLVTCHNISPQDSYRCRLGGLISSTLLDAVRHEGAHLGLLEADVPNVRTNSPRKRTASSTVPPSATSRPTLSTMDSDPGAFPPVATQTTAKRRSPGVQALAGPEPLPTTQALTSTQPTMRAFSLHTPTLSTTFGFGGSLRTPTGPFGPALVGAGMTLHTTPPIGQAGLPSAFARPLATLQQPGPPLAQHAGRPGVLSMPGLGQPLSASPPLPALWGSSIAVRTATGRSSG
eukprot:m.79610 g.79610  ORF g.79610 m.79610 type:complete len:417 (-) comp14520_c2_seq1:567-1817(-)